jgi:hypothetical protein
MNPHPTRSKPCKIGRKHTHGKSEKQRAKIRAGHIVYTKRAVARRRRHNAKVHLYFIGEVDLHP